MFNEFAGVFALHEIDRATAEACPGQARAITSVQTLRNLHHRIQFRDGNFIQVAQTDMTLIHQLTKLLDLARFKLRLRLVHPPDFLHHVTRPPRQFRW